MAFKTATNTSAFLKAGFLGFAGAGKTFTAVELMIAFHKYCNSKKPVFFCDTETGSDWAIPLFKKEGISFQVDKTRSFKELIEDVKYAEKEGFGLIIDSVSHYWKELVEAFQKKLQVKRLSMHHWGPIKEEWCKFSTLFVNTNLHVIVCGRAGWEWDQEEDEEGHKELIKKGTKMKAGGEFGFEPSLLIEMERYRTSAVGSNVVHVGHILKDRRMDDKTLDGKSFEWKKGDPTNKIFLDLLPHIEWLNLGGQHIGVDTSSNSGDLFDSNGKPAWKKEAEQKTILLEEIEALFTKTFPGQSAKEKKAKITLAEKAFGTSSWTRVQGMELPVLKDARERIKIIVSYPDNIKILLEEKEGDVIDTEPREMVKLHQQVASKIIGKCGSVFAAEDWLKKMNTSIQGLTVLDDGQLVLLSDAIDDFRPAESSN